MLLLLMVEEIVEMNEVVFEFVVESFILFAWMSLLVFFWFMYVFRFEFFSVVECVCIESGVEFVD